MANNRDDFSEATKKILADRAGHLCSRPECQKLTTGPTLEGNKRLNNGIAAHITAAAPGGARYDASLTSEERKSIDNGIWLCTSCANIIDRDEERYPVEVLRSWKQQAEEYAYKRVTATGEQDYGQTVYTDIFNDAIQDYCILEFLHEDPTVGFSTKFPDLIDQFVIDIQVNILEPFILSQKEIRYKAIRDFTHKLDSFNSFLAQNMMPAGKNMFIPIINREMKEFYKYRDEIENQKLALDKYYQIINDNNSIYAF